MDRSRAYVETSIPSFYHEIRTSPDAIARRDWTRVWWAEAVKRYELVTSVPVLEELAAGQRHVSAERLALVEKLPVLPMDPPVLAIVEVYIQHKLMPKNPGGDAWHLALASYFKCDFLVTWNCRHLANANKFGHSRRVNTLLGLCVPALVTPLELMGVQDGRDAE